MTNLASKTLGYAVGAVSGLALVFWVALSFGESADSTFKPGWGLELGATEQIRMIFIGSSACGAHRREGLKDAVKRAKQSLAERVIAEGRQFVSTGVAVDWQLEIGPEFLAAFGEFDEIIVGGNWLNSGAIRYVWRDYPGVSTVPQLIVMKRVVTVSKSTISVGEEDLLARFAGAEEIMRWVELGMPIELE